MNRPRPVSYGERIVELDVLRGWALAGILVVNIQEHLSAPANLTDSVVGLSVRLLANAKFYPLFTFLFAAGCAVHMRRLRSSQGRTWPLLLRRAGFLYVTGAVFYILVDHNPILMEYAVLAPLLWALMRLPSRAVVVCACVCMALAITLPLGRMPSDTRLDSVTDAPTLSDSPTTDTGAVTDPSANRRVWQEGRRARSYKTWSSIRASTYWRRWPTGNTPYHFLHLVAIGCVGVLVFRNYPQRAIPQDNVRLRRIGWWSLAAGGTLVLGGALAGGMFSAPEAAGSPRNIWFVTAVRSAGLLGGPLLSLYYATIVVLALRRHPASVWQHRLAAAGRMAFTNFVMQSVVMVSLFYGLGLEGRIGATTGLMVAVSIWFVQLYISSWCMARYRFGPIEWLWRTVTYARIEQWKVSTATISLDSQLVTNR